MTNFNSEDSLGYLGINPKQQPQTVTAARSPTSADQNYNIGTTWIDTSSDQVYCFTNVTAGAAVWSLTGPGASDVDTLTADSGGAISPAAGTITIAGGTNITTAGAGNTITANLDAAIALATSVTAPLYTAGAGVDLGVTVPTGQNAVVKLGDAAAANFLSITDSADSEVAQVNSDGEAQFDGNVTTGGNLILSAVASYIQMNAGAVTDFCGQSTLTAGTVTVANTNITANDRVFVTRTSINGSTALGVLEAVVTASTNFVINARDPADATVETADVSVVDWFIVRTN